MNSLFYPRQLIISTVRVSSNQSISAELCRKQIRLNKVNFFTLFLRNVKQPEDYVEKAKDYVEDHVDNDEDDYERIYKDMMRFQKSCNDYYQKFRVNILYDSVIDESWKIYSSNQKHFT